MPEEKQKDERKASNLASKVLKPKKFKLSSSLMWALIFTLLIAAWVVTGEFKGGSALKSDGVSIAEQNKSATEGKAFRVRTAEFPIVDHPEKLVIRGRTLAGKEVEIRAETAGLISRLGVKKGEFVKKGDLICQLEDGGRTAALFEAKALLAQTEGDFKASQTLKRRGHTAGLKVLQNKAAFDRAKASLLRAELDLERTKIKAPFDGYIDRLPSKTGSFLSVGGPCATLVSLDPLVVIGAVKERDIGKLRKGREGIAHLVTGVSVKGEISFIAARAENETRTFRIDLLIPNKDGTLKSGVTADIEIPLAPKRAVKLPPSILTLNDSGKVGVRVVSPGQAVKFYPVKILSEEASGIWIEALPPRSKIITVGQDFVKPGQKVEAVQDPKFLSQKPKSDGPPGS
jgi:multidrug efflux system membrane fusion protein